MLTRFYKHAKVTAVAAFAMTTLLTQSPAPASAQGYQIDCAILLCLSGGFPPSVPCARARAEFIRRVTPWPIEPPLQIWRCPMGVSGQAAPRGLPQVFEALLDDQPSRGFTPWQIPQTTATVYSAVMELDAVGGLPFPEEFLRLAQQADVDISSTTFDFVRSIRVIDISYSAWVHESEQGDHNCIQGANRQRQGVYGSQGEFTWEPYRANDPSYPPTSWVPFSITMENGCPVGSFQGIGVEWRDFEGNHSTEIIRY